MKRLRYFQEFDEVKLSYAPSFAQILEISNKYLWTINFKVWPEHKKTPTSFSYLELDFRDEATLDYILELTGKYQHCFDVKTLSVY